MNLACLPRSDSGFICFGIIDANSMANDSFWLLHFYVFVWSFSAPHTTASLMLDLRLYILKVGGGRRGGEYGRLVLLEGCDAFDQI